MKRISSLLLCCILGIILFSCGSEKPLPDSALAELDGAEQAMFESTSAGDSATFRKLCGIDYFTINANGESHNLEESVPYVPRFKGSIAQLSEQTQRVYGNFAIRNGRAKIFIGDEQVAEVLYTTGWIYRDDRWQFVHWQGTMTGMMLEPLMSKVMIEPPPVKR